MDLVIAFFAIGSCVALFVLIAILIKKLLTPSLPDEFNLEKLCIKKKHFVVNSSYYEMLNFNGEVKPKIQMAFQRYLRLGLKERVSDKPIDFGRFNMCTHLKPVVETEEHKMRVKYILIFLAVFTTMSFFDLLEIFDVNMFIFYISLIVTIFLVAINFYKNPTVRLFFPKWNCMSQSLKFSGLKKDISFNLQDIESLELTLIPYTFRLNIQLKDGTTLFIENRKFKKILSLYKSVVYYQPELAIQLEEQV